jgi:xylulokinase
MDGVKERPARSGMTFVLGIDLGLSGARAAVVNRRGGLLSSGRAPIPAAKGHRVSPGDWRAAIIAAVRQASGGLNHPAIDAIGIGALGPCPVLLDAAMQPLGDAPLFSMDSGAEAERQSMLAEHGLTPAQLGPDHVLPRLRHWQRREPELIARAAYVVDAAGYLAAWLTGRPVMDPATQHDHVVEGLAPVVALPEVCQATSFAGPLTNAAATKLGLAAGIPVTTGGYDSYVDLNGAGLRRAGQCGLLLGSTIVLGVVDHDAHDRTRLAADGLRVTPFIGEMSFAGGWTSSGGSAIDWARRLAADAAVAPLATPGAHGLLVLPYLAGERAPVWDPLARGAILGLTLDTTAGDLGCAIREAVALSTLDIADRLASVMGPCAGYRAAGGGLRDAAWAQDTSDALGVPLETVAHAGEAMGPAMLALTALGHDVAPVIAGIIRPDPRRHARYRELLAHYRSLYPMLKETLHALGRMAGKEAA